MFSLRKIHVILDENTLPFTYENVQSAYEMGAYF